MAMKFRVLSPKMAATRQPGIRGRGVLFAALALMLSGPIAWAAFLEKQYVICKYQGMEVLCDRVVVQKNDFVIQLLKQKGEISHTDFPRFLAIFQRLNPAVQNIDVIYPGQQILVPLKIIPPGTLEGQSTGLVTLPVITITNIPDGLRRNSLDHLVMAGDSVSALISRQFGRYNTNAYNEALEIFKYLNPHIKDINKIQVGQTLHLPAPRVRNEPWYPEVFDHSGKLCLPAPPTPKHQDKPLEAGPSGVLQAPPVAAARSARAPEAPQPRIVEAAPAAAATDAAGLKKNPVPETVPVKRTKTPAKRKPAAKALRKPEPPPAAAPSTEPEPPLKASPPQPPPAPEPAPEPRKPGPPLPLPSIFSKSAAIFGARLLDSGEYFFPRSGQADLRVDLAATPVMEFPNGGKLLFTGQNALSAEERKVIKGFWKTTDIITLSYDAPLRELLSRICRVLDPKGCRNEIVFSEGGAEISVRGDYIYQAGPGRRVVVCLIDRPGQAMPGLMLQYLQAHGLMVKDWIDSGDHFGPARTEAAGPAAVTAPVRLSLRDMPASDWVRRFAGVAGLRYQEQVEISFPYAGFQVKARASLLSLGRGRELLLDFGDLQGDAISAISATGLPVLQLRPKQNPADMMDTLLGRLSDTREKHPRFRAALRDDGNNTRFQVPGQLAILPTDQGAKRILFTPASLHPLLLAFLNQSGVTVVETDNH